MAIVGDKSVFAIEWNITRKIMDYDYANFCFWINGYQLGDFEDEIILSSTLKYLEIFIAHFAERTVEILCGRSKEDVFTYIYDGVMFTSTPQEELNKSIIKSESNKVEDFYYLGQLRERFHLDDVGGPSFRDKFSVILFNDGQIKSQRLIWRDLSDMSIFEGLLPENYFDCVARKFLVKAKS